MWIKTGRVAGRPNQSKLARFVCDLRKIVKNYCASGTEVVGGGQRKATYSCFQSANASDDDLSNPFQDA